MEIRAKLYTEFTKWLENRSNTAKEQVNKLQESGCRDWMSEEYSVTECNSAYQESLKNDVTVADMIAIRLQAGHLKACRRASRLRHETVPRLLAHGCAEQIYLTNGLYKKYLTDKISGFLSVAKQGLAEKES
ncbi:MAG: hypothetical protein Q4D38_00170 [Planctomycetia bacterium]|nr:hypothetical protein [Planctomycetia bacterium]